MKIKDHKLVGKNISFKATTKTSGKFKKGSPDTIIIHYTAGNSAKVPHRAGLCKCHRGERTESYQTESRRNRKNTGANTYIALTNPKVH